MKTRLPLIKDRIALNLQGSSTIASDVIICWEETSGGTEDPGTGGQIGGTTALLSGSTRALGYEAEPKNHLRQHAEIQAGDLILELAPDPVVALFDGQLLSGTRTLDELAGKGLRYVWNGRYYTSKEVGPDLQAAWDVYAAHRRLYRMLLLKRAT